MKGVRNLLLFFLGSIILCSTQHAYGQLADSTRIIVQDGYIEKMDNNIAIKVGLNNVYETFSQEDIGAQYKVELYPNITTNLSFALDYRFISASLQFAPAFFPGNGDDDIHGTTKSFSLGLSTIFSHWAISARYAKVKGYYLRNTPSLFPEWQEGDPYFTLPNHETQVVTANIGYSFNHKLSMRSLTTFTERQLKSAGSFIPAVNFEYFRMDPNQKPNGTTISSNQSSDNYETVIGPAYFYNYVLKEKFFVSLGLHLGLGWVHTKFITEFVDNTYVNKTNDFAYRWDGKAAIGYNGRDFFTGFYVNVGNTHYEPNQNQIIQDLQAYYQFVIGVRLESPKWVKRQMKKLDEVVKL